MQCAHVLSSIPVVKFAVKFAVPVCRIVFNWDVLSELADNHSTCGMLQEADVYAFGVLLWEMLTSSRAWAGLRHAQIICMVGVQKQALAIPKGLPPTLETLLTRCLARNPSTRPSFKSIADTLSHYVQVTRGVDAAELWGQSALAPLEGCMCPQARAVDRCTRCKHISVCTEASCLCCHFASAASPAVSQTGHKVCIPQDSAAAISQVSKQSPSMPKDSDAAGQTSKQSACCTAVSKLDMEAAIASAKADQVKESCASTPSPSGKSVRHTLLSL